MEDLYHLRGVLTFVTVFAATIGLPGILLAYYGIEGIRAEQRAGASEVQRKAEFAADAFKVETTSLFRSFEDATLNRLKTGQSLNTALSEMSETLRVVFRFDADSGLLSPFRRTEGEAWENAEFHFSRQWSEARLAERAGDSLRAAALYLDIARQARGQREKNEAMFARGRALAAGGETRTAESVFSEVVDRSGALRDATGFRLADLARLKRGETVFSRDPVAGEGILRELVEGLLAEDWTIGEGGEAAVARRAIDVASSQASREWVASARGRLKQRSTQLYWAERLISEEESLGAKGRYLRLDEPGAFSYHPRDMALWAMTWTDDDQYVFALDTHLLHAQLNAIAERTAGADSDVAAAVFADDANGPAEVTLRRTLSPWLPSWSLVVYPRDPAELKRRQADEVRRGIGIILLSVLMIGVGAVLSVRLVQRELDAARTKSEFAANVSHELRSPITAIRLKAEALQLGLADTDASRSRHYDVIVREAERLSRMVDNMLDFAAIERGQKKYTIRPGDLGATVSNLIESARITMELRGITIDLTLPEDLPVLWHDSDAVAQVVANLLSNAAKYGGDAGWIGVEVRMEGGEVVVAVSDRGIGIAPDEQRQIFEQYYRSSDPQARRKKGTGIGLTIVKYIMEAHGGRVAVRSEPGKGTTFTLHFPIQASTGSSERAGV